MAIDETRNDVDSAVSAASTREEGMDCVACGGRCCHYVTCRVETPETVAEADNIRWYLLHRDVSVFVDLEGQWFVQFDTPCRDASDEGRCLRYQTRPMICREYGEDGTLCEYACERPPYKAFFKTVEDFDACVTVVERAAGDPNVRV